MENKTLTQISETLTGSINEKYEVVAHDKIANCTEKNLLISGALLYKNCFTNVIFDNCTFFGSKILESQFIRCQFINCKFQFSSIIQCQFSSCNFNKVQWDIPFIESSHFLSCSLDHISAYYISKNENILTQCFNLGLSEILAPSSDEGDLAI